MGRTPSRSRSSSSGRSSSACPTSCSTRPGFAVFAFLAGWGDFIFALTILNGSGIEPITLGIYTYLGNYSTDWGAVMAAGVFAMVPAAILLVVAQRYIASGLTAGSVKG